MKFLIRNATPKLPMTKWEVFGATWTAVGKDHEEWDKLGDSVDSDL